MHPMAAAQRADELAAADAVPSLRSERVIGKPLARHTLREFFSPLL